MKPLLASLFPLLLLAQTGQAEPAAALTRRLQTLVTSGHAPGLQYYVADAQGIRFAFEGGWADLTQKRAMTAETSLPFASTSKSLTALLVLQVAQERGIPLSEPLQQRLPDFPLTTPLPLIDLLRHSSGLPNPLPLKWLHLRAEEAQWNTKAALYEQLRGKTLGFAPGSKSAYSNLGYGALGLWLEAVTGQNYSELLRQRQLQPLGLEGRITTLGQANEAVGYQPRGLMNLVLSWMTDPKIYQEPLPEWQPFHELYHLHPAYGGLRGQGRALAQWSAEWLHPQSSLLAPELKALALAPQTLTGGKPSAHGLVFHRRVVGGITIHSKTGGGPGFQANLRLYPEQGLASVVLANATLVREGKIQAMSDELDAYLVPGLAQALEN